MFRAENILYDIGIQLIIFYSLTPNCLFRFSMSGFWEG